jgi:hypothetical protein
MTVFIACAEADRPVAEALEKFLERRGLFVEIETGARGFRPVQGADAVVILWSKDTTFSPYRLLFEKRAMEAWADEQLTLVKLDHTFSPVGLRDLAALDASFDKQRDIAWAAVAKVAQDVMKRPRSAPLERREMGAEAAPPGFDPGAPAPAPQADAPPSRRKAARAGALGMIFLPLAALVFGAAAYAAIMLGYVRLPAPEMYQPWLPIGGAAAAFLLVGLIGAIALGARRKEIPLAPHDPAAPTVFVSYARADNTAVLPVVEAVQAQGRNVWIDKQGIAGGEGWAGEIVRAIRGAHGVVVMCSRHAFESDHVKREVYLADRYRKPMVPIFLEPAPPPEDFEYFFAGVQWLELHKTPAADRPAALAKALRRV